MQILLCTTTHERSRPSEPRGSALDAAWPCTPVAHLAHETDTNFTTIHCSA